MREKGYLDRTGMTAKDLVKSRKSTGIISIEASESVAKAIDLMSANNYSQIPVTSDKRIVGSLSENALYKAIVRNPEVKNQNVETVMEHAFPFVDITTPVDALAQMLNAETPAVLVKDFKTDEVFILTQYDIIKALC
jgi:predicted transcriptional regulator